MCVSCAYLAGETAVYCLYRLCIFAFNYLQNRLVPLFRVKVSLSFVSHVFLLGFVFVCVLIVLCFRGGGDQSVTSLPPPPPPVLSHILLRHSYPEAFLFFVVCRTQLWVVLVLEKVCRCCFFMWVWVAVCCRWWERYGEVFMCCVHWFLYLLLTCEAGSFPRCGVQGGR